MELLTCRQKNPICVTVKHPSSNFAQSTTIPKPKSKQRLDLSSHNLKAILHSPLSKCNLQNARRDQKPPEPTQEREIETISLAQTADYTRVSEAAIPDLVSCAQRPTHREARRSSKSTQPLRNRQKNTRTSRETSRENEHVATQLSNHNQNPKKMGTESTNQAACRGVETLIDP